MARVVCRDVSLSCVCKICVCREAEVSGGGAWHLDFIMVLIIMDLRAKRAGDGLHPPEMYGSDCLLFLGNSEIRNCF